MPTVGSAYVQIIPSAQGISGTIQKELSGGAESAGVAAGSGFGKQLTRTLVGLGIGKAVLTGIKNTMSEGADLQQSLGGIETLFKKNADTVIKNAQNAYQTAGLSANDYMENVTSFSASLISSLGGDTAKAAGYADRALRDMSDNANKMGTDMATITGTYQSLARGNYAMLDNLKLGYGGTKAEMERLIADSSKMKDVQKELGVEVDKGDMSFANMVNAISVMQKHLDITGTTAEEAATTFSGSFASMRASAENLMGTIATGQDIGPSLDALGQTVSTFVTGNLLPMLGNIVSQIPTIMSTAISGLTKAFPGIEKAGTKLIEGLSKAISGPGGSKMIESGLKLVSDLAKSIGSNIGPLLAAAVKLIATLNLEIVKHIPEIIACGGEILAALLEGIGSAIESLGQTAAAIVTKFGESVASFASGTLKPAGERIVNAISTAVTQKFGEITRAVTSKMKEVKTGVTSAWTGIKSAFTSAISTIRSKVASGFNSIKNRIANTVKNAASKVSSAAKNIRQYLSFSGLASKVSGLFNRIKSSISDKIESAKRAVSKAVSAIKGFFPLRIGKIFSGMKLPHFSVNGGSAPFGIGGKGTKPSISVSWYKKAMEEPYMFSNATLFGAGEAGDEMLYGRRALMSDIANAMNTGGGRPVQITNNITINNAENPEDFAERFVRKLKMDMRTA